MRKIVSILTLAGLVAFGVGVPGQRGYGQLPAPGIGFRNDLKTPVIVQGVSLVGIMQRRGQPFLIKPGKTAWDSNLPMGLRYYTIYDGNRQRILLRNRPVRIDKVDQFFAIRMTAGILPQVKLDAEKVPKQ